MLDRNLSQNVQSEERTQKTRGNGSDSVDKNRITGQNGLSQNIKIRKFLCKNARHRAKNSFYYRLRWVPKAPKTYDWLALPAVPAYC